VWEDQYEEDMRKYNDALITLPIKSTATKIDWLHEKAGIFY